MTNAALKSTAIPNAGPALLAQGLAIGYKKAAPIAENLDCALHLGELVCLVGVNGAGKSTLLRTLAGMQPPLKGSVLLSGEDIRRIEPAKRARKLAVVLTQKGAPGVMSAFDLAALGRHPHTGWLGGLTKQDKAVVARCLEQTGALPLAGRLVFELSDGERQKVMIARALAQDPEVLVLDEPTAFVDLPRRVELMGLLRGLAHGQNMAVICSTHDLEIALAHADSFWLMEKGGGFSTGAPEDLVLSGSLERAFAAPGVNFDRISGSFAVARKPGRPVALVGEPGSEALLWTQKALVRAGFAVKESQDLAPVKIFVKNENGRPLWL
ncbi:MAG: ABC transporter ATP-binding protein, partial [Desulfatibacillaceae bacterium]|nr:ABC transporter ATP-binding protein [Desulfatibacillaceae bacterium]